MAKGLTAYQKHVKSFAKGYAGKNLMKAAARAWNKKTSKPKAKTTRATSAKKRGGSRTAKGKMFGSLSGMGVLEDFGWGWIGGTIFKGSGVQAVPLARIVQGAVGYAANRRGKQRLLYGVIDYIDNYLVHGAKGIGAGKGFGGAGAGVVTNLLGDLSQVLKVRPL